MSARSQLRRRPRPVYSNAHQIAMRGSNALDPADVEGMHKRLQRAINEFSRGMECAEHWRSMADAMNMAETFATTTQLASDDESRDRIAAAQHALAEVFQRYQLRKSWALRAAELDALRVGLLIHDVQLRHCSHSEFARCYDTTRERIAQALAGNASPNAIIVKGQL